ncbi:MAG: 50S ribosomal protein L19 [Candidatus Yanofskybacteria bacterium RIFCSPLOWO2_01_FULL_49_17]|uniref:50S ribosomal protein L19 n=1 Tax=Candidatus Yanofskybacteria bacterium RIFCSPLOWO2_01_FULL_49_17 TaxID=1802700 RepID=A0A1F8GS86_9BACT|nr:MAG: 50S ribosomal protein L19 [Candidatus Yanofskybacteria bacterium RIFCSPLOWO2_01_FULL_49_17]
MRPAGRFTKSSLRARITGLMLLQELKNKFEDVRPGWTVRVNQRIQEGGKSRVQAFEGMVIARKHGNEAGGTITVRKVADGVGVEKIFPIYLPSITSVKVMKKTNVRRAKLYYLRQKSSKEIRKKIRSEVQAKTETPAVETASQ